MQTHITSRPSRATLERYSAIELAGGRIARPDVLVWLSVAKRPWGRLGTTPHQLWDAFLGGSDRLVYRHRDPTHESCRELVAKGLTGTVAFIHSDGTVGMVMDIERGAKLATFEDDAGIRTRKYVPFDRNRVLSGRKTPRSSAVTAASPSKGANTGPCDDVTEGRA